MEGKRQKRKSSFRGERLSARKKVLLAVEAGNSAKAIDPVALRIGKLVDYTDYFVIMSGESTVQVRAIYEKIMAVIAQTKSPLIGTEGEQEGRWVVVDWGDVVIHIFLRELRDFYELEKLWADAPRMKLTQPKTRT